MADDTLTPIEKILASQIALAESQAATDRMDNTAEAVAYYECRAPAQAVNGRSCVISPDLSNMVEAVCADIAPTLSGDSLAEFDPADETDLKRAALESAAVSHMIMRKARAYATIVAALRDCLLSRIGYLYVAVEKTKTSERSSANGVSAVYLDDMAANLKPGQQLASFDYEPTGETVDGEPTYNATMVIETTKQRFVVRAVAPENMLVSSELDTVEIESAQFVAERYWPTRAELINMGADKAMVDRLPMASAKDNDANRATLHAIMEGPGKSGEHVKAYNCFLLHDEQGGDKPELRRYVTDERGHILFDEPAHCIPYVAGAVFLVGHEHSARSLHDKLKQVQDSKTAALRQYLDNMANMNNRRTAAVEGEVDLNDLTTSIPGGVVRIKSPNSIMPFPLDDIGGSSQQLLQYLDIVRSEAGGASLDMQGAQSQIVGDTAAGIDRQYTAKEKLASYMLKNFGETLIYSLYKVAHKQLRYYWEGSVTLKTGDDFQQVVPAQWPEREAVTVKQGKRKAETLGAVLGLQREMMGAGLDGILVDAGRIYNAVTDLARAGDIAAPDRYYIDPSSQQAQQAMQQKAQAAQAQAQAQQQLQERIMQTQVQIETLKQITNRAIAQMETAQKYWSEVLRSEIEEAKIVGTATKELQAIQLQGELAAAALEQEPAQEAQPEAMQ